ncbi:MAG: hypothetical protein IJ788_07665 [Oscillospiraceae bacterium]|nr:hypothetical protein [Oscillospiraceae bacterium]MBR1843128.1 hypothetical protein [Oscillospiraceae bacterium]
MEETKEAVVEEKNEETQPDELELMRRENEELRMKLKIMEQNELNLARSTGTRHTESQQKPYDPFDEAWL